MAKFYAGVDLSARSAWFCILDPHGNNLVSRKVANDPGQIYQLLEPYRPGLVAVVESSFNCYWLLDFLQDLGHQVKMAHPLYLKGIAYAKLKTDRVDAHTLAQLLRLGYIPEAFIYPRELRPTRGLLRRRNRLVNMRAGLYRHLKLQLMSHNITHFDRNAIKKIDGRNLRALLPQLHDRRVGLAMVHLIEAFDREVRMLEQEIRLAVRRLEPIVLLETIPGVDKTLAPTIYYKIGQIHRFASDKAFASYCRLAPTIAQSGSVTRKGKNRKQGNPYLKWAFSEAAQMAIQRRPAVRRYFLEVLKKKKKRIVAKSILTHKLAIAAFHVLTKEQAYRHDLLTN